MKSSSKIPHPWPLLSGTIYRLLKQQPVLQSDFPSHTTAQVGFSTWLCKWHWWSNWIYLFQCIAFRPRIHIENTPVHKVRWFAWLVSSIWLALKKISAMVSQEHMKVHVCVWFSFLMSCPTCFCLLDCMLLSWQGQPNSLLLHVFQFLALCEQ